MVVRYAEFSRFRSSFRSKPGSGRQLYRGVIGQMKRFCFGDVRGDSEGSEEEAEDLSSEVLPSGLFVIHDAAGSCHHDVAAKERNLS